MKTVTTAADLGKAIKNGESEIAIEGDLAQKVIRIKATGNVAWAIALGAVTIGIAAVLASLLTACCEIRLTECGRPAAPVGLVTVLSTVYSPGSGEGATTNGGYASWKRN